MLIPRYLASLCKLCDDESSRYALAAVSLERDGDGNPLAVATDGRAMAVVSWQEPLIPLDKPVNDFSGLVHHRDVERACKLEKPSVAELRRQPGRAFVQITSPATGQVEFVATNSRQTVTIHEGKFPRWKDAIPRYTAEPLVDVMALSKLSGGEYTPPFDAVQICVDPMYLIEVCKIVAAATTDEERKGVILTIPVNHERPMTVSNKRADGRKAVGIIMPLYGEPHSWNPRDDAWHNEPSQPKETP